MKKDEKTMRVERRERFMGKCPIGTTLSFNEGGIVITYQKVSKKGWKTSQAESERKEKDLATHLISEQVSGITFVMK